MTDIKHQVPYLKHVMLLVLFLSHNQQCLNDLYLSDHKFAQSPVEMKSGISGTKLYYAIELSETKADAPF